ncbi:MAG: hypothetical protein FJY95_16350 [Candidatus Handelsmanbacteria bacterium]|nr:hypothetical protein [Candidatus Handelsmanbacteria bacterium]
MAAVFLLLLVLFGLAAPPSAPAVDYLTFGTRARPWTADSLVFNALEQVEGRLGPLVADSTENLLPRVKELGGSAVTSVAAAAARSNQILRELTDNDYTTGWRVYTNPNGAELNLDLGAVFILSRVHMLRGVLNSDERSLRGYEIYANDGDSLNFVGSEPIYSLIAQDRSHGAPELDVRFRPQAVRYLRMRSTGERSFQMGDMEIFGIGVTPFAHYISKVIDLGQPANFGPVEVHAAIDSRARLLFSTKTGSVDSDSLYYKQTGIPGEFAEVPREQFDRSLDPSYAGVVRVNNREWSPWSPPYADLEGPLGSPDNRQYLQFEFRFISNGLTAKAQIDSLRFAYTVPAIADSVVGEIAPATAQLGQRNSFTYHLRSVVSRNRRGFDTVLITTPFAATATAVNVDGVSVPFTQESSDRQLRVTFAGNRIKQTGQQLSVVFDCLVAVSGTEFRGEVADSKSDAFPQRIIGADADPAVEGNTLVVGGLIEDELFTGVQLSGGGVLTPNGDRINDALQLDYILLKATSPVLVKAGIHDLSGALVRTLYAQRDLSGPNRVPWDGRNEGGDLVPPGLYLLRLSVRTDAGETTRFHTVAVAY